MIIKIVCCIAFAAILSIAVIPTKREANGLDEGLEKLPQLIERIKTPSFSVSEYHKRKEEYLLSLQAEKEKQEPYLITLWWGFDGLRLNADGTTEWISRRPEPEPKLTQAKPSHRLSAFPASVFENGQKSCGLIYANTSEDESEIRSKIDRLMAEKEELETGISYIRDPEKRQDAISTLMLIGKLLTLYRDQLELIQKSAREMQMQNVINALQPPPYPQNLAHTPDYIHSIQQTYCGGPY